MGQLRFKDSTGRYSDFIALDTDVEYYPDFPIPGFPFFLMTHLMLILLNLHIFKI